LKLIIATGLSCRCKFISADI